MHALHRSSYLIFSFIVQFSYFAGEETEVQGGEAKCLILQKEQCAMIFAVQAWFRLTP
jgi:hypothetical protein